MNKDAKQNKNMAQHLNVDLEFECQSYEWSLHMTFNICTSTKYLKKENSLNYHAQ